MRLSESAYDRSLNLSSHDQLNQQTVLYDSVVVWGNFDIFENLHGLALKDYEILFNNAPGLIRI